jgi:L-fucose isomerase-like protein
MSKLRIGIVGLFHRNARGDNEAFERVIKELEVISKEKKFDLHVVRDKVYCYDDGCKAVDELNDVMPDFTFLFSASVTMGDAVIPFGHLRSYIGIWAIPEGTKEGFLPLNSFCGSMIFAGTLTNYLKDHKIPYKWFYGYTSNKLFKERFEITIKAMKAIKKLKNSRIGCIGPLVEGFDYMATDESKIESMYGTYVGRLHSVEEIIKRAKAYTETEVNKELIQINKEGLKTGKVSNGSMNKFARLCLAFKDFAKDYKYNALSISCWPRVREEYGVVPCGAISRLNESGIIASCERDVEGAIGMIIDTEFNNRPASMVDLVSLDESDSSLNIWHCGPAPISMANPNGLKWDEHFNMGDYKNGEWNGCSLVADMQFKPGKVTISRISSRTNEMVVFSGDIISKVGYQGSSGWVNNFSMQGKSLSLEELISLIYNYRIDHHMTFGYGDNENAYLEFANWKGINIGKRCEYVPYLQTPAALDKRNYLSL